MAVSKDAAPEVEKPAKVEKPVAKLARPKAKAKPAVEADPSYNPIPALIETVVKIIDDAKGEEIVTLDLVGKTSLADAMIVASGKSDRHVGAIAERIIGALRDMKQRTPRVEGMPVCDWVLIDTGDIIIHLFRPEVRGFYNIEKLWGVSRPLEGELPEPADKRKPALRRAAPDMA